MWLGCSGIAMLSGSDTSPVPLNSPIDSGSHPDVVGIVSGIMYLPLSFELDDDVEGFAAVGLPARFLFFNILDLKVKLFNLECLG